MTAPDHPAPPEALAAIPRAGFCTTCGAALSEQARFCPSCGVPVTLAWHGLAASPGAPAVTLGGTSYRLASFWRRLGAMLIDSVVWSTVGQVLAVRLQGPLRSFEPRTQDEAYDFLAQLIPATLVQATLVGLLGLVVFATLEAYGWTPGKAALGLRVLRSDGHRPGPVHGIARYGGKILGALILYLGYLWALWDRDRQAWHDKFANTYVVALDGTPAPEARTFGPPATTGGAWAWAVLTLVTALVLASASLAVAGALPRDGGAYRRFFEGASNAPRPRAQAPAPAGLAHPRDLLPRIERFERIERA